MSAFDPDRAHVLAVGIESYEYGAGMDLPGAATAAVRFARWARAAHVPARNIQLACNWLDPADDGLGPDAVRFEPTHARLDTAFIDLATCDGDLLLLFWCGHGLLSELGERVLFTCDASVNNKRNHRVDELLAYLRSNAIAGFGSQVLLIDACANFVEDMRFDEHLPRTTIARGKHQRAVAQFALYAAGQGQIAQYNRTKREATFSTETLTWLRKHARKLPPDVDALRQHVDKAFAALRDAGKLRQTPVYWRVRHASGSEDTELMGGGMPVPGTLQKTVRSSGLTVSQVHRVARALAAIPMLETAAARSAIQPASAGDAVAWCDGMAERIAAGAGADVFAALRRQADSEADLLAVGDAEACWRRQELIAPALRAFDTVTRQQILEAFHRAVPAHDGRPPHDLDEAMERAADAGHRLSGDAALHLFVAGLEHATGQRVADEWFGLSLDRLLAVRARARLLATEDRRLVIDFRNPESAPTEFTWPATVDGHLFTASTGWKKTTMSAAPADGGPRRVVRRLLDWAYQHGLDSFSLGLILPRGALDEVPEAWEAGDLLREPAPLWHDYPTVIHCGERLSTPQVFAAWTTKARAIRTRVETDEVREVGWITPDHRDDPRAIRSTVRDAEAVCFGLEFAPRGFGQNLARDPIIAIVTGGAPYLLWAGNEPQDWTEAKQRLLTLVSEGDFDELPQRVHDLRTKEPAGLGASLRLMWDEPDLLPPRSELPGMAVAGGVA